jgi:7-carboxy-7-deazaguanine synthase
MTPKTGEMLSISEIFGVTLQGEGVNQGKPCSFIRTALCNLDCKWCDTPFTWDWTGKNGIVYSKEKEIKRMSIQEIVERLDHDTPRIVISGGEPMIQQKNLFHLAEELMKKNHLIEIETNGTIEPSDQWKSQPSIQFNVSPKLAHSGVSKDKAIKISTLKQYEALNSVFKFVVKDADCIEQIKEIVEQTRISNDRVWLMPEGRTSDQIINQTKQVFDLCVANKWNLTSRLQVLAYNDKRGI